MTKTKTTWTDHYAIMSNTAAAHRATGIRKSEGRKDQANYIPAPLNRYVTSDVAHDGAVDELLRNVPTGIGVTKPSFERHLHPSPELCAKMVYAATRQQMRAEASPVTAVTGTHTGRKATVEDIDESTVDQRDPFADIDSTEEVAAVLASLPVIHRETLTALMDQSTRVSKRRLSRDRKRGAVSSDVCPDDVQPRAWAQRVVRARNAFRAVWVARQNPSLRGFGGVTD